MHGPTQPSRAGIKTWEACVICQINVQNMFRYDKPLREKPNAVDPVINICTFYVNS